MKKAVKKLVLNRETLHSMEDRRLMNVGGAVSIGKQDPYEETGCPCQTTTCYPATACYGSCSCSG
jgi:hypothetical protein